MRAESRIGSRRHARREDRGRALVVMAALCLAALTASAGGAREIHVTKTGSDSDSGGSADPYLTIGKAAQEAQVGDNVVVHGGTYREWLALRRRGSTVNRRLASWTVRTGFQNGGAA